MNRRNFLQNSLATTLMLGINKSIFAKTNTEQPNLLVIMLRGGVDGLSMLVPYSDQYYYDVRSLISIKKQDCLKVNETFGLNPALKNSFFNCYQNNQAIFIPAAGQLENSRSHFQSQDVMEYGVNLPQNTSGFLGRLQEVLTNAKGVCFTENVSSIFKSEKITVPNITNKHIQGWFNYDIKSYQFNEYQKVYENVQKNMQIIDKIKSNQQQGTILSNVAQYMKISKSNIGFIDFGDWDTHSSQGSLDNQLFHLLKNLDKELLSFKETMGEDWKKTVVVIMSEFGRTVKQNGNGTDHGHGNLMTIMGGLVTKSKVAGDWLILNEKNLHENRDIPVFYDYRSILAELFKNMYDLNNNQLNYIFPNVQKTNFGII